MFYWNYLQRFKRYLGYSNLDASLCGIRINGRSLGTSCLHGIAHNLNHPSVSFESDKLTLIGAYRQEKIHTEIRGIVEDIKILKSSFEGCAFTWVAREGNTVALTITLLTSSGLLIRCWPLHPPPTLQRDLLHDSITLTE